MTALFDAFGLRSGEGHLGIFIICLAVLILLLIAQALRCVRRTRKRSKGAVVESNTGKARSHHAGSTMLLALMVLAPDCGADFIPWTVEDVYQAHCIRDEFEFISCKDLNHDQCADILFSQYDKLNDCTILLIHSSRHATTFSDHLQFNLQGHYRCLPPDDLNDDGVLELLFYSLKPDTLEFWSQVPDYSHKAQCLFKVAIPGLLTKPMNTASLLPVIVLPDRRGVVIQIGTAFGGTQRSVLLYKPDVGIKWQRNVPSPPTCGGVTDLDGDGHLEMLFGTSSPGNGTFVQDIGGDDHSYELVISETGELVECNARGSIHSHVKQRLVRHDGHPIARLVNISSGVKDDKPSRLELKSLSGEILKYRTLQANTYSVIVADLDQDGCDDILLALQNGRIAHLNLDLETIAEREFDKSVSIQTLCDLVGDGNLEIVVTVADSGGLILDNDLNTLAILKPDPAQGTTPCFLPTCFWQWEGGKIQPAYLNGNRLTLAQLAPSKRTLPAGLLLFLTGLLTGGLLVAFIRINKKPVAPPATSPVNWEIWYLLYRLLERSISSPGGKSLFDRLCKIGLRSPENTTSQDMDHLLHILHTQDSLNMIRTINNLYRSLSRSQRTSNPLGWHLWLFRFFIRRYESGGPLHSLLLKGIQRQAVHVSECIKKIVTETRIHFTTDLGVGLMQTVRACLADKAHPIQTVYHLEPVPALPIFFDRKCLFIVLENILGNAKDALKDIANPEIHFHLKARHEWIHLEITDNGPGLDPAQIPNLFVEGSSSDNSRGFGLPRCHYLINRFDGSINSMPHNTLYKGAGFLLKFRPANMMLTENSIEFKAFEATAH
ncbi:MAG: HAMP domain-containing histidine kinase [bacterium]|nr:HAMP domain-containing histidine kinase [bacterium]